MIKSTKKLKYKGRNRRLEAFIIIELKETSVENGIKNFNVVDYILTDEGAKIQIESKPYFQTAEQINQMDDYLEATNDFSGMGKMEKEALKLKLGLLHFVQHDFVDEEQTEIIYGAIPSDFILE